MNYTDFVAQKLRANISSGFKVDPAKLHPNLMPHQRDLVQVALNVGRFCIWADTGLGKAFMELEWATHVNRHTQRPVLIVAPLGVAHQIAQTEAVKFGYSVKFIESGEDINNGLNITNYEKLDRFDLSQFAGVALDAQLGYDGSAYLLPPIEYHEHPIGNWDDLTTGDELLRHQATGLNEQRQLRNLSQEQRCRKALEIINANPDENWLIWCETNAESELLAKLIPDVVEVRGADNDIHKRDAAMGFASGAIKRLVSKPSIFGFGMNFQVCHNVIYIGLTHSFEAHYQSVRRVYRYGQNHAVQVHIIQHVLEGAIVANLQRKEKQAAELSNALAKQLTLSLSGTYKSIDYNPNVDMDLPDWLTSAAQKYGRHLPLVV